MSISAMDGTEYCIVFLSFLIDININKKKEINNANTTAAPLCAEKSALWKTGLRQIVSFLDESGSMG